MGKDTPSDGRGRAAQQRSAKQPSKDIVTNRTSTYKIPDSAAQRLGFISSATTSVSAPSSSSALGNAAGISSGINQGTPLADMTLNSHFSQLLGFADPPLDVTSPLDSTMSGDATGAWSGSPDAYGDGKEGKNKAGKGGKSRRGITNLFASFPGHFPALSLPGTRRRDRLREKNGRGRTRDERTGGGMSSPGGLGVLGLGLGLGLGGTGLNPDGISPSATTGISSFSTAKYPSFRTFATSGFDVTAYIRRIFEQTSPVDAAACMRVLSAARDAVTSQLQSFVASNHRSFIATSREVMSMGAYVGRLGILTAKLKRTFDAIQQAELLTGSSTTVDGGNSGGIVGTETAGQTVPFAVKQRQRVAFLTSRLRQADAHAAEVCADLRTLVFEKRFESAVELILAAQRVGIVPPFNVDADYVDAVRPSGKMLGNGENSKTNQKDRYTSNLLSSSTPFTPAIGPIATSSVFIDQDFFTDIEAELGSWKNICYDGLSDDSYSQSYTLTDGLSPMIVGEQDWEKVLYMNPQYQSGFAILDTPNRELSSSFRSNSLSCFGIPTARGTSAVEPFTPFGADIHIRGSRALGTFPDTMTDAHGIATVRQLTAHNLGPAGERGGVHSSAVLGRSPWEHPLSRVHHYVSLYCAEPLHIRDFSSLGHGGESDNGEDEMHNSLDAALLLLPELAGDLEMELGNNYSRKLRHSEEQQRGLLRTEHENAVVDGQNVFGAYHGWENPFDAYEAFLRFYRGETYTANDSKSERIALFAAQRAARLGAFSAAGSISSTSHFMPGSSAALMASRTHRRRLLQLQLRMQAQMQMQMQSQTQTQTQNQTIQSQSQSSASQSASQSTITASLMQKKPSTSSTSTSFAPLAGKSTGYTNTKAEDSVSEVGTEHSAAPMESDAFGAISDANFTSSPFSGSANGGNLRGVGVGIGLGFTSQQGHHTSSSFYDSTSSAFGISGVSGANRHEALELVSHLALQLLQLMGGSPKEQIYGARLLALLGLGESALRVLLSQASMAMHKAARGLCFGADPLFHLYSLSSLFTSSLSSILTAIPSIFGSTAWDEVEDDEDKRDQNGDEEEYGYGYGGMEREDGGGGARRSTRRRYPNADDDDSNDEDEDDFDGEKYDKFNLRGRAHGSSRSNLSSTPSSSLKATRLGPVANTVISSRMATITAMWALHETAWLATSLEKLVFEPDYSPQQFVKCIRTVYSTLDGLKLSGISISGVLTELLSRPIVSKIERFFRVKELRISAAVMEEEWQARSFGPSGSGGATGSNAGSGSNNGENATASSNNTNTNTTSTPTSPTPTEDNESGASTTNPKTTSTSPSVSTSSASASASTPITAPNANSFSLTSSAVELYETGRVMLRECFLLLDIPAIRTHASEIHHVLVEGLCSLFHGYFAVITSVVNATVAKLYAYCPDGRPPEIKLTSYHVYAILGNVQGLSLILPRFAREIERKSGLRLPLIERIADEWTTRLRRVRMNFVSAFAHRLVFGYRPHISESPTSASVPTSASSSVTGNAVSSSSTPSSSSSSASSSRAPILCGPNSLLKWDSENIRKRYCKLSVIPDDPDEAEVSPEFLSLVSKLDKELRMGVAFGGASLARQTVPLMLESILSYINHVDVWTNITLDLGGAQQLVLDLTFLVLSCESFQHERSERERIDPRPYKEILASLTRRISRICACETLKISSDDFSALLSWEQITEGELARAVASCRLLLAKYHIYSGKPGNTAEVKNTSTGRKPVRFDDSDDDTEEDSDGADYTTKVADQVLNRMIKKASGSNDADVDEDDEDDDDTPKHNHKSQSLVADAKKLKFIVDRAIDDNMALIKRSDSFYDQIMKNIYATRMTPSRYYSKVISGK